MLRQSLLLVLGLFIFFSCSEPFKEAGSEVEKKKSIEELSISDQFNFETTKDQNLKILLPNSVDYSDFRSKIGVYTAPVEAGGKLIGNVTTNAEGVYEGHFSIPTCYDSLFITSHAGEGTMVLSNLKSTNSGGIIDFGEDYGTEPPIESEVEDDNLKSAKIQKTEVKGLKTVSINNNVIANGGFDDDNFGTMSSWYIPANTSVDKKWYLSSGSYYYPRAQRVNDNGNYVMQLRSTSYSYYGYYGGIAQLIEAKSGDVVSFTASFKGSGSSTERGYLYLIPRDINGRNLRFYNVYTGSVTTSWNSKTVVATMPPGTVSCEVLIWSYARSGSNIYWDNVVVTGPVTDSDNDGVSDEDDEYPNDVNRAFNIYYPNKSDFGSIGFEDNWPATGDYDFNDLVVDYQYKQVVNSKNELVDLQGKFVTKAIGASYDNGFGFQINTAPGNISSVTGTKLNQTLPSYVTLNSNGTEAGQSKANIIVYENAFDILPHPGGGIGVNTETEAVYVQPDTLTINVAFANPVSRTSIGSAPFNPYMIVDQERGREVHLSNMEPTDLCDAEKFQGKMMDTSDPATGRYFKTYHNLPWAINIPVSFDYAIEKAVVTDAHLHFAEWAESVGALYPDWYLNKNGYRNDSKIYSK